MLVGLMVANPLSLGKRHKVEPVVVLLSESGGGMGVLKSVMEIASKRRGALTIISSEH